MAHFAKQFEKKTGVNIKGDLQANHQPPTANLKSQTTNHNPQPTTHNPQPLTAILTNQPLTTIQAVEKLRRASEDVKRLLSSQVIGFGIFWGCGLDCLL